MGKIKIIYKIISKKRLLYEDKQMSVLYHKGKIIIAMGKEIKVVNLPMTMKETICSKFRLLERMMRLEPRFAIRISYNEVLFSHHGYMCRLSLSDGLIYKEMKYREGMNNPLSLCNYIAPDKTQKYLIGDYWGNPGRDEVNIYSRKENGDWDCIYSFPKGSVMHIHQIIYDRYRNQLLIATGDKDKESAIWKADLNFKNVVPLLSGKQIYRSCFIIPTKNGFYYATDSPVFCNGIYYYNFKKKDVQLIYPMPGPCIFGRVLSDGNVVMATSVEPDSSIPMWRYRFTRCLGAGVRDYNAHLIYGNLHEGFRSVLKIKKDRHLMWLFQFGNYYFPIGDYEQIKAVGIALKKCDGITIQINDVNI